MKRLQRFIAWGENVLHDAERGDPQALAWCGFVTLTVVSIGVVIVVQLLRWWLG